MSLFPARLYIPGQTKLPLNVEVDISEERLSLTAMGRTVADWPLGEVDIEVRPDGFHLEFDNEEIVLSVTDTTGFADELGMSKESVTGPKGVRENGVVLPLSSKRLSELRFEDVTERTARLAEAMVSDTEPPDVVFGRWLRLLKEINAQHGRGSLPTQYFTQLNTELLDLMPDPSESAGG